MAIAHDATSTAQGTGTLSWTHTPTGTPAGVCVEVAQAGSSTDEVTGVTYGGVAMTRVRIAQQATGEAAAAYAYELLASIPTGAQTVQVSVSGATDKRAMAATMTSASTVERNTDNAVTNSNATNPTLALTLSEECTVYVGGVSGETAASTTTDSDYTIVNEEDVTSMSRHLLRRTANAAAGTETVNWTFTNDEICAVAVAFNEPATPDPPTDITGFGAFPFRSAYLAGR